MQIVREKLKNIRKRIIPLKNLIKYENIDVTYLNKILNEVISENVYNTFDLLKLVMHNYEGDIIGAIKRIDDYSNVRFNCYHACKMLKEKLDNLGINSYLISYKSIGFSNKHGDDVIKEAHMSLVIPTLRNNKVYYILMDPGLRIPACLEFYRENLETDIEIDNDKITIKKFDDPIYNYTMIMEGFNRYTDRTSYTCQEYFDLDHEIVNPSDTLFPGVFYVLLGYRAIRFSENKEMRACIKLLLVDECLEISWSDKKTYLTFAEINNMSDAKFRRILKHATKILDIDDYEFMILIRFIINIKDEIKNTLLYSVL